MLRVNLVAVSSLRGVAIPIDMWTPLRRCSAMLKNYMRTFERTKDVEAILAPDIREQFRADLQFFPDLAQEVRTYYRHRDEWLPEHRNQYAVIRGEHARFYDSELEAVRDGDRRFRDERFLVKRITEVELPAEYTSYLMNF